MVLVNLTSLMLEMAFRLSALQDWVTDDLFKPTYNTYQVPQQVVPSQHPYLPALRTKQDLIDANQFLNQLQTHAFAPQYSTDYMPQYPSYPNKTLYPTLDLDYNQQSQVDMTPSTSLYPQLFDQSPVPSPHQYVGMGTRMSYDQTKLVYDGTLRKAAPRGGSEELVQDMEKMDVDSESKETPKNPKGEAQVKSEEEDETKAKHLALVKQLQKLVQEMLLDQEKEVKKESAPTPMENLVPVAAH